MKKKVSLSWSGGKDSAFALYQVLQTSKLEVVNLHTSLNQELKRVGMHGTPELLIEAQAESADIPLEKVYIPADNTNNSYEKAMLGFYKQQKEKGVEAIIFGDIFLEDLKTYREQLLAKAGLEGIFPLWMKDTRQLIHDFVAAGFKTLICAADARFLQKEQVGKVLDLKFIEGLPQEVDPCGERGEFHTFVFEGPLFKKPVRFQAGEIVSKSYSLGGSSAESLQFWFADLNA